jgi:membrane protease YdiL (CAAX protease family)
MSTAPAPVNSVKNWRNSRLLILAELLIVAGIFIADATHHIYFSKTIYLFFFAWISLRLRRLRWRDIGLRRPENWRKAFMLGLLCGVSLEALELFVTQPLLVHWLGMQPDLEVFQALRGSIQWTILALLGAWTLAAFGEEMVYRGYLMNRVADLFGRTQVAWIVSLLLVHIGFGLAHAYQGITGVIDEGLMGLLLGVIYLRTGKNLWVPILAHGISDSIDVLLLYSGHYPGMH